MKYLVTSEEMKKYDTYTINEIGISGDVLMERAAMFAVELILDHCKNQKKEISGLKVLVVCGQGNNGGDGLAVARLLWDQDCKTDIYFIGNGKKVSPEVGRQLNILQKYGIVPCSVFPNKEYDVIVDALFGIGLNREVSGEYADAIDKINEMNAWKLSLDIPSGIDSNSGRIWGKAVKADVTATFAFAKRGLYLYPGTEYAGEIKIGEIGINKLAFAGKEPEMFYFDERPVDILSKRNSSGNKGTFGKILILAGNMGMAGAAILCSKAVFRTGAGMVKVITSSDNQLLLQKAVPEAMFLGYDAVIDREIELDASWWKEFEASYKWADCILAGPGIGKSKNSKMLLEFLLSMSIKDLKPLVLDADALNLIAENKDLQKRLSDRDDAEKGIVVMTPHVAELARLLDCKVSDIKDDFVKAARTAAAKYDCIMVCKDARTIVCEKEGPLFLNIYGNSGMATAGSGDVLSGIIAALYGAEKEGMKQAILGVHLHSKAGDYVASQKSEASVMASDIIEALPVLQKGN